MRTLDLFAGIGGIGLGLAEAGHRPLLLAENWAPAAAVLAHRFPEIENSGDVAVLARPPAGAELLTAGFPCQDLSQAGRTAGIAGPRSGLVGHVFRLLDAGDVPHVLIENVSFMLSLEGGRAMAVLVEALERRGYRWAYRVVSSLAFLPQRRERVFLLASRWLDPAAVLLADEATPPELATTLDSHAHGFYWTEGIRGLGWAADAVPTLKNGSAIGIPSPPAILLPDGRVVTPDIRDAERLQGFPAGWTDVPGLARASLRWSLVGNAVTVPVAAWIGGRLAIPGRFDPEREAGAITPGRWPRAARFDGERRVAVRIGAFPVVAERPPLVDFLEHAPAPLSPRATAGFLGRTERSSLRFPPGFRERLREHLARMAPLARRAA